MRQSQTLVSILIFLVALSFLYFIFWDHLSASYEAFLSWRKALKELQSLQALIDQVPAYSQKYQEFFSQASLLFEALPAKFSESDPLVSLAALSSGSGLVLHKIQIGAPDLEGKALVDLTLIGNLAALERFLQSLETGLPFFDLVSVGLRGLDGIQDLHLIVQTHVLSKITRSKLSFEELKLELDRALAVNLDILKDSRFSKFKLVAKLPLALPSSDLVGRSDPFAPL